MPKINFNTPCYLSIYGLIPESSVSLNKKIVDKETLIVEMKGICGCNFTKQFGCTWGFTHLDIMTNIMKTLEKHKKHMDFICHNDAFYYSDALDRDDISENVISGYKIRIEDNVAYVCLKSKKIENQRIKKNQ